MVQKTFDVREGVYKRFSRFCKERNISVNEQIELFMESMAEDEPEAKREYLEKLEEIRKGKFIRVKGFAEQYGL